MYVCICNALTDHRVKDMAASIGAVRPGQVYAACGCRLQCGQCVRAVAKLLREHLAGMEEQPIAAE